MLDTTNLTRVVEAPDITSFVLTAEEAWHELTELCKDMYNQLDEGHADEMRAIYTRPLATVKVLERLGFDGEALQIGTRYLYNVFLKLQPAIASYREPYDKVMGSPLGALTKIPGLGAKLHQGFVSYLYSMSFPEIAIAKIQMRYLNMEFQEQLKEAYQA